MIVKTDFVAGFHFRVDFLPLSAESITAANSVTNNIRFKRVSGIAAELEIGKLNEGGRNTGLHSVSGIKYNNLVLERGYVPSGFLLPDFNDLMSKMTKPGCIMVTLLNEENKPQAGWAFYDAYLVKWNASELNAENNSIVIETIEFAYNSFKELKV
jgi:phage tail-like protein